MKQNCPAEQPKDTDEPGGSASSRAGGMHAYVFLGSPYRRMVVVSIWMTCDGLRGRTGKL